MYLLFGLFLDPVAVRQHPVRDTLAEAMAEADTMPERDAQVLEVSGLHRVVAAREFGQLWHKT
jgi:hypothetical protein